MIDQTSLQPLPLFPLVVQAGKGVRDSITACHLLYAGADLQELSDINAGQRPAATLFCKLETQAKSMAPLNGVKRMASANY